MSYFVLPGIRRVPTSPMMSKAPSTVTADTVRRAEGDIRLDLAIISSRLS
jgi:hypothetical protein